MVLALVSIAAALFLRHRTDTTTPVSAGADATLHVVPGAKTFKPIPFRWRVERTFAWLGRWRRLSKDYEGTTSSSEAFVKLAMIHLMNKKKN